MVRRRILSLWFPRLGADRVLRLERGGFDGPLAVVEEVSNAQVISALNPAAECEGLWVGQPVRDAHAICAGLVTRPRVPLAEAQFLMVLRRWAGKFSPWVAEVPPDGLILDLSGCAHLFGGEEALLLEVKRDCAALGVSVRLAIADTLGAAWAVARYGGAEVTSDRTGDAIDQEARATRSRAHRLHPPRAASGLRSSRGRHWTKGGAAPEVAVQDFTLPPPDQEVQAGPAAIVAPGQTHRALAPLAVAALRLDQPTVAQLNRLGLRRIGDLLAQPRASLARRFGRGLVERLDQAMGAAPEPVSPARAPDHFAVRLSLPDPIGLLNDLMAGVDRMLPQLCKRLEDRGKGVRILRLEAHRVDQETEMVELGLARPTRDPARIRPLLEMKLDQIDAGYGIDMLRIEALRVEPIHDRTMAGHAQAQAAARRRLRQPDARRDPEEGNTGSEGFDCVALEDLIGRLGARVGLENIKRLHPVETHIPEKTAKVLAAAWSEPAGAWPRPTRPRPLLMWQPELVMAPDCPQLPERFRWRGRDWVLGAGDGPERIAPEWWLDDPNWRSGVRDYWVVTTTCGARLWLFFAHGGTMSGGWFCHGRFA